MALQHTGVKSQDAPIYTLQLLAMDVTKNDRDLKGCVGTTAVLIS